MIYIDLSLIVLNVGNDVDWREFIDSEWTGFLHSGCGKFPERSVVKRVFLRYYNPNEYTRRLVEMVSNIDVNVIPVINFMLKRGKSVKYIR